MGVNWRVRIKNKMFWMTLIPALILLIQMVAAIFGWELNLADIQGRILAAVDALFSVLTIIGVIADPTTSWLSDSARALTYNEPAPNVNDAEN